MIWKTCFSRNIKKSATLTVKEILDQHQVGRRYLIQRCKNYAEVIRGKRVK